MPIMDYRKATPAIWIELISAKLMIDINVLDPDGWRRDLKGFEDAIDEDEFKSRVMECTMSVTTETGNNVDALRMFDEYLAGRLSL